ncbi:Ceramide kinase [Plecturocebus cupreus]
MDVSSVHHNSTLLRYSVSLLGYGFYGDIIKDSEKKRWLGLARYDFSDVTRLRAGSTVKEGCPREAGEVWTGMWMAVNQILPPDPSVSHRIDTMTGAVHSRSPGAGTLRPRPPASHLR